MLVGSKVEIEEFIVRKEFLFLKMSTSNLTYEELSYIEELRMGK